MTDELKQLLGELTGVANNFRIRGAGVSGSLKKGYTVNPSASVGGGVGGGGPPPPPSCPTLHISMSCTISGTYPIGCGGGSVGISASLFGEGDYTAVPSCTYQHTFHFPTGLVYACPGGCTTTSNTYDVAMSFTAFPGSPGGVSVSVLGDSDFGGGAIICNTPGGFGYDDNTGAGLDLSGTYHFSGSAYTFPTMLFDVTVVIS